MRSLPLISGIDCFAYKIPTDALEGDGTLQWNSTGLVVVCIEADTQKGLGYSYCDAAAASIVAALQQVIVGSHCDDLAGINWSIAAKIRNLGRSGIAATALSAIDIALWDLKAKLLDLPVAALLDGANRAIPVYGSGGFTTYDNVRLGEQLSGWVEQGCKSVKMKVGAEPDRDPDRIAAAKDACGSAELFIDANGAFNPGAAVRFAASVRDADIRWFEEPVSSDDETGLSFVREHLPASMELAAGEYIYTLDDARHLLQAHSVDVLQADVTRCGGISGFMKIAALADAFHVDLSGHCAPSAHRHVAGATARLRHLEWFHDHVRIEQMLFDGAPTISDGTIQPDLSRPGIGLDFKFSDAERFRVL
jgi:L-alanine-DL-glutamate epimerase-like enolase superfamily enzyme